MLDSEASLLPLRFTLGLCFAAPAFAGIITATNSATGLFDAASGARSITFSGLELGYQTGVIRNVVVSVNFVKADGENFDPPYPNARPYYNEIVLRLTSPASTTVNLINANSFNMGAFNSRFDGVILFDSAAAQPVNQNPNQPLAGRYRPIGNLNNFRDQIAAGAWSLFIQDTAAQDALRVHGFTVEITTDDLSSPEATTLTLLGLGLLTLAAAAQQVYRISH